MQKTNSLPTISFVIPTLNAQRVLKPCLRSILSQNYPKSKIEIIIADGGSSDKTLEIAKKFKAKIISNPLKTAEAGKAAGVRILSSQFTALVDSDNILPNKDWLRSMVFPLLNDSQLVGSEPIKFTYRKRGGYIERYSALIGANDPYAFVSGIYDRFSYISLKWTNLNIDYLSYPKYIKIKLESGKPLPTIGANGTIFKTSFLKQNLKSDYLFDIDIISQFLQKRKNYLFFAKVQTGIIHTYCESSVFKFIKKQQRRVKDYFTYKNIRSFDWGMINNNSALYFLIYTLLIIPSFYDSLKGFLRKPDLAWFFHPIACLITLAVYSLNFLKYKLHFSLIQDRNGWQQ